MDILPDPIRIKKDISVGGRDGICVVGEVCGTYLDAIEIICSAAKLALSSAILVSYSAINWGRWISSYTSIMIRQLLKIDLSLIYLS